MSSFAKESLTQIQKKENSGGDGASTTEYQKCLQTTYEVPGIWSFSEGLEGQMSVAPNQ